MFILFSFLLACANEPVDSAIDYDLSTEVTSSGGAWTATWISDPAPIPFNEPFSLAFAGPDAGPDAAWALDVTMPEHGHGMQVSPLLTPGDGELMAEGLVFHMIGIWEMTLEVDGESATFYVDCCE